MTTLQMNVEQGEVWLVRFPFTDLTNTKLRPAVVWAVLGEDVIVVGVFSKAPVRPLKETWVSVEEGTQDFVLTGLAKTSIVKAEKLAVIHRSVLQRRLGSMSPALMAQIEVALKKALHLG